MQEKKSKSRNSIEWKLRHSDLKPPIWKTGSTSSICIGCSNNITAAISRLSAWGFKDSFLSLKWLYFKAAFLYYCPHRSSLPVHLNSISWATWAIWAALKKFSIKLQLHRVAKVLECQTSKYMHHQLLYCIGVSFGKESFYVWYIEKVCLIMR